MILDATTQFSEVEGTAEKIGKFNLKNENQAMIFRILRKNTYSNPIRAVIREYVTNALDANITAKNENPVRVNLPNLSYDDSQGLVFSVRDYGFGLSDEEIVNIFASYGASTKRNSNEVTGMLGIGSKSGFAYGDSFTIVSRYNGYKTTYNAVLDESELGDIVKMFCEPTNEESGIEIIVPISSSDIEKFREEALDLFKFFSNPVEVFCGNEKVDFDKYNSEDAPYKGGGWDYWNGDSTFGNKSFVIMGNIGYPIDAGQVVEKVDEFTAALIEKGGLVLHAPIGSVDFAASRENLRYTKKTIDYLVSACSGVSSVICNKIKEEIDKLTTLQQVAVYYKNTIKYNKAFRLSVKDLTWRGFKINNYLTVPLSLDFEVFIVNESGSVKIPINQEIDFSNFLLKFVVNDVGNTFYSRILEAASLGYVLYQIKITDGVDHDDLKKQFPIGDSLIHASNLPRKAKKSRNSYSSYKPIYSKSLVVFHGQHYPNSESWRAIEDEDLETTNKFYVNLYNYDCVDGMFYKINNLSYLLGQLKVILGSDVVIFGLKPGKSIPKDMEIKSLSSFLREYAAKNEQNYFIHKALSSYMSREEFKLISSLSLETGGQNRFINPIWKNFVDINNSEIKFLMKNEEVYLLSQLITTTCGAPIELATKKICSEIIALFPFLKFVPYGMTPLDKEMIIETLVKLGA